MMIPMIDYRSDTVTSPTPAMRQAMADAAVGDDVWGDDPTVIELEAEVADLLGKPRGLFVSSGTQSNLCALMAHCQRGDEYIVGDNAHTYRFEAGGGAVLGSIQPQPVTTLGDGRLDLDHVARVIKPADIHFARSRLLCLENTHDGKVLGLDYQAEAAGLARERGLAVHLDGARLWNAAAALGVEPREVAEPFDTVSVCLSKGLGAPIGSVLVGSEALVADARRWRKMLGGAMRQVGIVAAGGLHAVRNHRGHMVGDHANAERLAAGLASLDGVSVDAQATNMVFVSFEDDPAPVVTAAAASDIRIAVGGRSGRLVTHFQISESDVEKTISVIGSALR